MLDILGSNDQWPGVYYDVHGDTYDEAGATYAADGPRLVSADGL